MRLGGGVRVARARQRELEAHEAAGLEARSCGLECGEAAQHEAGSDQQDQGQGDLAGHEDAAQAGASPAPGQAGAAFQRVVQVDAGRLQRGRQREDEDRQERDEEREQEHAGVDRHRVEARQVGRRQPHQQIHEPEGEGGAEDGAAGGEEHAFGQELADEPEPARAQRRARRDLVLALGGAGQQQVRDVAAGDQQHEGHRA